MPNRDRFDRDFDRDFDRTFQLARVIGAVISLLVNLALTGLVFWAVIAIVQWLTSK